MAKLKVTTRVRLTVDMEFLDTWEPTASAEQIHEQASEMASNRIKRIIDYNKDNRIKLIGECETTMVIVKEGK